MNHFADPKFLAALAAAIMGAAGAYSGHNAATSSEAVLESALRRQSEAQLAGFELCRQMTERRAERRDVSAEVVPPVPNSLKALAAEPAGGK